MGIVRVWSADGHLRKVYSEHIHLCVSCFHEEVIDFFHESLAAVALRFLENTNEGTPGGSVGVEVVSVFDTVVLGRDAAGRIRYRNVASVVVGGRVHLKHVQDL